MYRLRPKIGSLSVYPPVRPTMAQQREGPVGLVLRPTDDRAFEVSRGNIPVVRDCPPKKDQTLGRLTTTNTYKEISETFYFTVSQSTP